MSKILVILILILFFIYIFPRRNSKIKENTQEKSIHWTTSRFNKSPPRNNIKFRPEDEIGVIRLDHTIYD